MLPIEADEEVERVINTVVNNIDGAESCFYSDDFYCTIVFTKEDIDHVWCRHVYNEPCGYCDAGQTNLVGLTLVDGRFVTIINWCGCMTYEPSYTVRDFSTLEEMKESYQNHQHHSMFVKALESGTLTKACEI